MMYVKVELLNEVIFKLEDKYKLANFTSIEWKPLNTEIVSEDGARV